MTRVQIGQLLVAVPGMVDPMFEASVVYVFDVLDGVAGVILNRPTELELRSALSSAERFAAPPAVVFHGGPVRTEHALALSVTSSPPTMLEFADVAAADPGSGRIFAGYSGWSSDQLAGEIGAGAWFVLESQPGDVTTPIPGDLWRSVLGRQDGPLRRYRTYPDDVTLN